MLDDAFSFFLVSWATGPAVCCAEPDGKWEEGHHSVYLRPGRTVCGVKSWPEPLREREIRKPPRCAMARSIHPDMIRRMVGGRSSGGNSGPCRHSNHRRLRGRPEKGGGRDIISLLPIINTYTLYLSKLGRGALETGTLGVSNHVTVSVTHPGTIEQCGAIAYCPGC